MAKPKARNLPKNWQVLNTVRQSATLEYQQRIPRATQSNIAQIEALLWDPMNGRYRNEFLDALVQRIGEVVIRSRRWNDPFREFKKNDLNYGATVEEIGIGLLRAHAYDFNDTAALLRVNQPYVATAYHTINRQDRYDLTLDETALRQAFINPTGLSELIAGALDAQINSDQLDEYISVHAALEAFDRNHGIFRVHMDAFDGTDDEKRAKNVLKQLRAIAGRLEFLSSDYTALDAPQQIKTFARRDNMVLFCLPEFLANIDVEALAQLFHMDKADVPYRIRLVDRFQMPDVQAVLMDSDALILKDTVYRTESFYNGAALTNNYFLHHQQIISFSPFLPMVAFTTGEGTALPQVDIDSYGEFKLGYIDGETGNAVSGVLPMDIKPSSQLQLFAIRTVNVNGKDMAGQDVTIETLDGAHIDVTFNGFDGAAGDGTATIGSLKPYVDRHGVLTIPDNFLELVGSYGEQTTDVQIIVTVTSASGERKTSPLMGSVKKDGKLYEANEKTRRALFDYMSGTKQLP